MQTILERISSESHIPAQQVGMVARLLDDGNTVPFIARYRKEMTGGLDEVAIRQIEERLKWHRSLEQRKDEVIRLIDEQGKLTAELQDQIKRATRTVEVEDIYLPFRPKRRTRAAAAREKGLEPLAHWLLSPQSGEPLEIAAQYISDLVPDAAEAMQGALDIIAEHVAEDPANRGWVRDYARRLGVLMVKAREASAQSAYTMYYDYQEPVARIPAHRILAINRGEREEYLRVTLVFDLDKPREHMSSQYINTPEKAAFISKAIEDCLSRLLKPAIERDLRSELTQRANQQAIRIFARNLNSLLLQPPVREKIVLGIDPAFRTGCKWAVVDNTGKMLQVGVIYPTQPHLRVNEAETILLEVIYRYKVNAIAIGNGTASRETEQFVAKMIKTHALEVPYTIVSEAGASVYSASPLAAEEFPDLDASQRSAVSIARRVQDPLAELVKIEPRSIGVGQYQHDLPPRELDDNLGTVVETAVNQVGVDLNTASWALLAYVSGLSKTTARNIVRYRDAHGPFSRRHELLKVPRLGPKAFEQAAGFLRIYGKENPLDSTAIHPESYHLAAEVIEQAGASMAEIGQASLQDKARLLDIRQLTRDLASGEPTLRDVIECLLKPHRDPRDELPPPLFRSDVLDIESLSPGMILPGTVRNVVDFGAFVDIGIKQDGLVHISELAERYVKHPLDVVAVGDVVQVAVISIDKERHKVALSIKQAQAGLN